MNFQAATHRSQDIHLIWLVVIFFFCCGRVSAVFIGPYKFVLMFLSSERHQCRSPSIGYMDSHLFFIASLFCYFISAHFVFFFSFSARYIIFSRFDDGVWYWIRCVIVGTGFYVLGCTIVRQITHQKSIISFTLYIVKYYVQRSNVNRCALTSTDCKCGEFGARFSRIKLCKKALN